MNGFNSTYSTLDRVAALVFWTCLALYSCYLLFTTGGQVRLRKQAEFSLPKTGRGLTLYWGAFVLMFVTMGILLLAYDIPYWSLWLIAVPIIGAALTVATKAIIKMDARWLSEKSYSRHPTHRLP